MKNITYYNRVDVNREKEGLSNIVNGLVKTFYRSVEMNEDYFNSIQDETIRKLVIEDLNEEVLERKERGSKRLRKLRIIPCLPEEADYANVSHRLSNSIIALKDVTDVRIDEDFGQERINKKYESEKKKYESDVEGLEIFATKIWVI